MPAKTAYDEPSKAIPLKGEVVLIGPGAVGVSMTAQAAAESSKRLGEAARIASGQARAPADDEAGEAADSLDTPADDPPLISPSDAPGG